MRTPERADDDSSIMMKSILESSFNYNENRVVCDRKVLHYLRSLWVQGPKKERRFKRFLKSNDEYVYDSLLLIVLRLLFSLFFNYYFVINCRSYVGLLMNANVDFFNTYMTMNIEMDSDISALSYSNITCVEIELHM